MQLASCIAFGNTCVLKPSEYTPLSILRLVELLEQAGVPPGVVNIVNGRGRVTGEALVRHPDVDRIAFTGGTETARHIMRGASEHLTPVHFELGGKSANIVFADADFDRALDGSLLNVYANNGQICIAGSRILVQRSIAEHFIERFAARVRRLRIGDPMDPGTEIGPLAFEGHMRHVLGYADLARKEGAEILAGGGRPDGFERGWYVEPTAVRVESNALRICQEEVFGPFATLQVFDEPEEAIAIANDSRFGLVSYGWTESVSVALKLQESIRAGTVWINTPLLRDLRAPFGGFKDSGIGRDGPRQCAEFYTEEKATIFARGKPPIRKLGSS
jgi:acyl-CoA reductase-like NAD-dependent aldehyde dehydrogenase